MKYRVINLKRKILGFLFSFFFMLFLLSPNPGQAEKFFKSHNTWYEKIPVNPVIIPNSSNYVGYVRNVLNNIYISYRNWSVPIWYAKTDTPHYDIKILDKSTKVQTGITLNGWNLNVPIPPEAKQAGYGDTGYRDGHMVVISADRLTAWDFFRADVDSKRAYRVCKWDLASDGIRQPYIPDVTGPSCHVAPTPLLHGLVTLKEIQNGYIDHALAIGIHSAKAGSPGVYPAETSNSGTATDEWAPWLGFRYQLDPSVDINSLGLNRTGRIVAKAMQEYGMIHVINAGPGENVVYFESLDNKTESWNGMIGNLSGIPMDKLRVVEPIIPPLAGDDVNAPAPPKNLQFAY